MPVVLDWEDLNYSEDGYKVYRSTSTMDPEALPTPLATLAQDAESYQDDTVVAGTTYYYRVSAFQGAEEVVSDEIVYTEPDVTAFNAMDDLADFTFDPGNSSFTIANPSSFSGGPPAVQMQNGATPNEALRWEATGVPTPHKPVVLQYDYFSAEDGVDDQGIYVFGDSAVSSMLQLFHYRQAGTDANRSFFLNCLGAEGSGQNDTDYKIPEGVPVRIKIHLDWGAGTLFCEFIQLSDLTVLHTTPSYAFDNVNFSRIDVFTITTQPSDNNTHQVKDVTMFGS